MASLKSIREHFVPQDGITRNVLEDKLKSIYPGRAQTKREAQLGSEGRTPWIFNGGSLTDERIKALRQETEIREYPESALRPSNGRQTDNQAASSATRTRHQTVAVHDTHRKSPTLPMTRVDPAYAARNVEHNVTEEDFKDFAEWKEYHPLRSSYSERNATYKEDFKGFYSERNATYKEDFKSFAEWKEYNRLQSSYSERNATYQRHGDRTSSIGSAPQPYQSAPHPNRSNALRSTDESGGDDDGYDGDNASVSYGQRPSHSRHRTYRHSADSNGDSASVLYGQRPSQPRHRTYMDSADSDSDSASVSYGQRPSQSRHRTYRHSADSDGDPFRSRKPAAGYESVYDDTYSDFPDGTTDHRSPFAQYGEKYKYTDASASRHSDEYDASTSIARDESSIINPFKRRGMLLDLPIVLGNGTRTENQVNAIPDTGATLNVISCRCLKDTDPEAHAQLSARRSMGMRSLVMADGSLLSTLGEVTIPCSFPDNPADVMQIEFHVCATLAENICVIVGREFLESTQTLTDFAYRMVERPIGLHTIPWVMHLARQKSNSRSRLRIMVNLEPTLACPDTGSEIDLFSASFAQRIGVQVKALRPSDPRKIQYADGRYERILGKAVVDVSIEKPLFGVQASGQILSTYKGNSDFELLSSGGQSRRRAGKSRHRGGKSRHHFNPTRRTGSEPAMSRHRTFYLVQGLACDIILGQAFLYSIDAYNTYKYAFVESGASNGPDTLNGIFVTCWTGRQNTSPTKPTTKPERNAALNEIDQQYILRKREVEKEIKYAKDSSTKRRHEAEKETLKQKHDTDSQRIRKQYDDFKAQYPTRR